MNPPLSSPEQLNSADQRLLGNFKMPELGSNQPQNPAEIKEGTELGIKYEAMIDPLTNPAQPQSNPVQSTSDPQASPALSQSNPASSTKPAPDPAAKTQISEEELQKQFISKAKQVIASTQNDPYQQEAQVSGLKQDLRLQNPKVESK